MKSKNQVIEGRLTYQYHKLDASMKWCKSFRLAVDAGAHIGTWAHWLAYKFNHVHAFEPVSDFRTCFLRNVPRADKVTLYPVALGALAGKVRMSIDPADTGGTHVDPTAEDGTVELRTLDSFELTDVDYFKVDAEGYELNIVQGAVETLKRCRPCCVIEQKQHKMAANYGAKGTPAVDFLKSLGAVVRKEIGGDWILSWD